MYRNYLYLNRLVSEISGLLINKTVYETFTQEKDKLLLRFGDNNKSENHILISTDSSQSYLTLLDIHRKAKKNTFSFFGRFLPDKIEGIFIAESDRIILIKLAKSCIYFLMRGSLTNVVALSNSGEIETFKKLSENELTSIKTLLNETQFSADLFEADLSFLSESQDFSVLKEHFPFLSKKIFDVLKTKSASYGIKNALEETFSDFLKREIAVAEFNGELVFIPEPWISANVSAEISRFNSYIEALNFYLKEFYKKNRLSDIKTVLVKFIDTEMSKTANKLNNLRVRINKGSREKEYKQCGNLLLMNRHKLVKGSDSAEVQNIENNELKIIKLDSKKSPQQNIDYYFEKSRDEKQNYEISKELYENSLKRYDKLKRISETIQNEDNPKELERIADELKIRKTSVKMNNKFEEKIRFKQYLIEGKYQLFVGKDSESNDKLSIKFAKQNDYWFHARSVAGSHVVLRYENKKEAVPKHIIKTAASVAAFHSKAKTSSVAPVIYTFAKYVVKKKGMPPGQVQVLKENVVLVKPEIPDNCEFIDDKEQV
ncbi:MAG: DUF814 domain-containing protein [Ignavibacteria bacterium]|nr:DUF814 domain-containing protein [Ignavibacteria bacterium]